MFILVTISYLFFVLALSLDIGGATYVHWGQDVCSTTGSQILHKGILASTDRVKGGAATIICLNSDLEIDKDTKDFKKHHKYVSCSMSYTPMSYHDVYWSWCGN